MGKRETDLKVLWTSFVYEINRATASLMYLLQGVESVRNSELPPYNSQPAVQKQHTACFPKLSYVDVPLSQSGIPFDLNDFLKRDGEVEQLAFKGWVEQVYNCIWESRYRNDLKEYFEGPRAIYPQADPIGDFRLIRNDLLHNGGVASEDNTGRCKVLKWFEAGDSIILRMRHVFDFLNQMALMSTYPSYTNNGAVAAWTVFPGMEDALTARPTPKIVSLRTSFDKKQKDGTTWHVVSVVFENGVFVNIPVDYAANDHSLRERIEFINKTCVDKDGNVQFPNGSAKDRKMLYREAVDALFHKESKIHGKGIPGPAIRFCK